MRRKKTIQDEIEETKGLIKKERTRAFKEKLEQDLRVLQAELAKVVQNEK